MVIRSQKMINDFPFLVPQEYGRLVKAAGNLESVWEVYRTSQKHT